eukprot:TRINITY_DN6981_c0_g2_i8.p1 TRINITY_DN6981_c0_g2~~TRINITY_DN6981_c0_g2_i8.p1  ORF type:complete len:122 (-),score=17.92 TRINITY_DN6981_c0_g2_i8:1326-1691(-)
MKDKHLKEPFALVLYDIQRTIGKTADNGVIENIVRRLIGSLNNIDYCQGMNFLVINLYTYLGNEEETFWMLLYLFKQCGMESLYSKEFEALKKTCLVIDSLVKKYLPSLWDILVIFLIQLH